MTGKGRGRGFTPNSGSGSIWSGGAPASPSKGSHRGSVSAPSTSGQLNAPFGAKGEGKRKSDVISPLPPVDGCGELKKGEAGRALTGETDHADLSLGDFGDLTLISVDGVGVAPVPGALGSGVIPGFQGPLFWSNPECLLHTRFSETSAPPFIVLLESRIPGKGLGRFNLIALGDLIDSIISDTKRQIFPNGRNQAKVFCDGWQAANVLVDSKELREFGVQAYIPASLVQKRRLRGTYRLSIRRLT